MKLWRIENTISGAILGEYEGATAEEALDTMAREAGYRTYAECDRVAPSRPGEIRVVEVRQHGTALSFLVERAR